MHSEQQRPRGGDVVQLRNALHDVVVKPFGVSKYQNAYAEVAKRDKKAECGTLACDFVSLTRVEVVVDVGRPALASFVLTPTLSWCFVDL